MDLQQRLMWVVAFHKCEPFSLGVLAQTPDETGEQSQFSMAWV